MEGFAQSDLDRWLANVQQAADSIGKDAPTENSLGTAVRTELYVGQDGVRRTHRFVSTLGGWQRVPRVGSSSRSKKVSPEEVQQTRGDLDPEGDVERAYLVEREPFLVSRTPPQAVTALSTLSALPSSSSSNEEDSNRTDHLKNASSSSSSSSSSSLSTTPTPAIALVYVASDLEARLVFLLTAIPQWPLLLLGKDGRPLSTTQRDALLAAAKTCAEAAKTLRQIRAVRATAAREAAKVKEKQERLDREMGTGAATPAKNRNNIHDDSLFSATSPSSSSSSSSSNNTTTRQQFQTGDDELIALLANRTSYLPSQSTSSQHHRQSDKANNSNAATGNDENDDNDDDPISSSSAGQGSITQQKKKKKSKKEQVVDPDADLVAAAKPKPAPHLWAIAFRDPSGLHIRIERSPKAIPIGTVLRASYPKKQKKEKNNDASSSSQQDNNGLIPEETKTALKAITNGADNDDDDDDDDENFHNHSSEEENTTAKASSLDDEEDSDMFSSWGPANPLPRHNMGALLEFGEDGDDRWQSAHDDNENEEEDDDDTNKNSNKNYDDDDDDDKNKGNEKSKVKRKAAAAAAANANAGIFGKIRALVTSTTTATNTTQKQQKKKMKQRSPLRTTDMTLVGLLMPLSESLGPNAVNLTLRFWKRLGHDRFCVSNPPHDYALCTDGLIVLAFHPFSAPPIPGLLLETNTVNEERGASTITTTSSSTTITPRPAILYQTPDPANFLSAMKEVCPTTLIQTTKSSSGHGILLSFEAPSNTAAGIGTNNNNNNNNNNKQNLQPPLFVVATSKDTRYAKMAMYTVGFVLLSMALIALAAIFFSSDRAKVGMRHLMRAFSTYFPSSVDSALKAATKAAKASTTANTK